MARPASHRLGRFAEWAALVLLVVKGYRPRHRNWTGGGGELDLVMSRGELIVFVEVKARRHHDLYGGAGGALDTAKQKRIVRASSSYLSRFNLWERPCRHDLVTVERSGGLLPWRIRHWRDVIQPDLGRRM
jgi:putative endonuclease